MELVMLLLGLGVGAMAGVLYAAWRLKGDMSMSEAVEILGGGGPKPTK